MFLAHATPTYGTIEACDIKASLSDKQSKAVGSNLKSFVFNNLLYIGVDAFLRLRYTKGKKHKNYGP